MQTVTLSKLQFLRKLKIEVVSIAQMLQILLRYLLSEKVLPGQREFFDVCIQNRDLVRFECFNDTPVHKVVTVVMRVLQQF